MGGKHRRRRTAPHECPCGHEQDTPGVCIVYGLGGWHRVPQGHGVCICHGLRLADIEGWIQPAEQ